MSTLSVARRVSKVLEPLVSMIFFVPEAPEEYQAIGLDPVAGYFMSRSAPMGRVSADVVASTFYNFNPALVRNALHWDSAEPSIVIKACHRAVRRAYERLLVDEDGSMPDVARATELLREAVRACPPEGRALFAAHAGVAWPDDDLVGLWFGANALREFRGDGHIAALVVNQVDAVEAIVLHAAYLGTKTDFLYGSRMWGDAAYDAARERLRARGFVDENGVITDGGMKFRDMIELQTDKLGSAPFDALGVGRSEELYGLLEPLARRLVERKGIPRSMVRLPEPGEPARA